MKKYRINSTAKDYFGMCLPLSQKFPMPVGLIYPDNDSIDVSKYIENFDFDSIDEGEVASLDGD